MDKLIEIERQKAQVQTKLDTCKKLLATLEEKETELLAELKKGDFNAELSKHFTS